MLAYSVDSAFTQFDWLLSSGNPCTIHLRTKTKCLPFSPIPTVTASDLGAVNSDKTGTITRPPSLKPN